MVGSFSVFIVIVRLANVSHNNTLHNTKVYVDVLIVYNHS